jgi:formylmethanofuran dehydrogenase subunit C
MSGLIFSLKNQPTSGLDCSYLNPEKLAKLSKSQIEKLPLSRQENAPQVADYFTISGDTSEIITFDCDAKKLDFIGAKMQRGTIICKGNVGDRLGDQMRRGTILVDGNAGDYAASRMVAGTVAIFGDVGKYTGFGMRRGTILLDQKPTLHATIQDCGVHTLGFLPILLNSFRAFDTRFKHTKPQAARRFAGDLGVDGKGEILVLNQEVLK